MSSASTPDDAASPRVSVVIPTMNRKDELVGTLQSLVTLELGDAEIIVVDDGSTDDTQSLDVAAIDPRIRMLRHPQNRGGSAARNSGIDNARAPLVALLDSDDRWLPGKLERQLAVAAQQPTGASFLIASNVTVQLGEERFTHNLRAPVAGEDMSAYLMVEGQAIQTSTMMLPTWLAREVRFRDGLRRYQDWDFMLRLLKAGATLLYDHEPLVVYNLNPDPNRVSRQRRRMAATLEWYKLAEPLLSRRAMQSYFVRSVLGRDSLREAGTALHGLAWLATRDPLATPELVGAVAHEVMRKLQGRRANGGRNRPRR